MCLYISGSITLNAHRMTAGQKVESERRARGDDDINL